MIVTYVSLKKGVRVNMRSAQLPSGRDFPHGGSFGPNKSWHASGKTMGASPDGRQLPEWIEFDWIERPYPENPNETVEEYRALPRYQQRVYVRDRVPQSVVEEVLQSKRDAPPGKLPEKKLWVYLVWTDDGIRMRWQLERLPQAPGEISVLRQGGDALP